MVSNFLTKQSLEFINAYDFKEPLHHYLKQQFRSRKQMGARDRRWTRELIYAWFRVGNSMDLLSNDDRLVASFFLVHHQSDDLANLLLADQTILTHEKIVTNVSEKLKIVKALHSNFHADKIFSFTNLLSPLLNKELFVESFLTQPKVWLRVKSAMLSAVMLELSRLNIKAETFANYPNAIAMPAGTAVHETESFTKGNFEIQDLSSQRTGDYFKPLPGDNWYDCCAASGGKSLLLRSILGDVQLTVSDNREHSLKNLSERFRKAGLKKYKAITADLENGLPAEIGVSQFDGIIADVPCSGSGTWSRNPEQMQTFTEQLVKDFSLRQQKILKTVTPSLKKGKPLIYITCSVFEKENEAVVNYALAELGFELESMQLIQGMEMGADTLFVARLVKK